MNNKLLLLVYLLLIASPIIAQTPTPQDCMGAIPICREKYEEPEPYRFSGNGNYTDEIYKSDDNSCITDEANGVWYVFTAQSSGYLRFNITPNDLIDDYDWIVFNMTNAECSELATDKIYDYLVSSNNYGVGDGEYEGATGANSDSLGFDAGNCNGPGMDNGPRWNNDIDVKQGQTYMLYLSNWSESDNGYSIDFSESTAQIYDNKAPKIQKLLQSSELICGQNQLTVRFNENVKCETVVKESFSITGNGKSYEVAEISSAKCDLGAEHAREFTIKLANSLEGGTYKLNLNSACDVCENEGKNGFLEFKVNDLQLNSESHTDIETCYDDKTGSITISADNLGKTIFYSIDDGKTYTENSGVFENLSAGDYQVKIKNEYGCVVNGSKIILSQPPAMILVDKNASDITSCYGDATGSATIQLEGGTGDLLYSLDNGSSFQQNNTIQQNMTGGTYTILAKDAQNCTQTLGNIVIEQPDDIQITDLKITDLTCHNTTDGSIKVTAKGGTGNLLYTLNTISNENGNFSNLKSGNYSLKIVDKNNCSVTNDTLVIEIPEKISIEDVELNQIICGNEDNSGTIKITATGGSGNYLFTLNDSISNAKGIFTDLYSGIYFIDLEDDKHCAIAPFQVEIENIPCLTVPSAFSPNGDGINDNWIIKNIDYYENCEVQVIDRWSRIIFQSKGGYKPWDGKKQGGELPADTYYYFIDLKKGIKPLIGSVTLVK